MLRALIEKIYCFINDLLLTDEKIKEILDKKLHELLDDNKADTYAVCWDKFDETITALVEGAEPNVTADDNFICAFTTISDNGIPTMVFSIEAIRRGIRYLNPLKVKEEIEGVAKHEAFHALRFRAWWRGRFGQTFCRREPMQLLGQCFGKRSLSLPVARHSARFFP